MKRIHKLFILDIPEQRVCGELMSSSVIKFVVISDLCSVREERRWCSASLRDHDSVTSIFCKILSRLIHWMMGPCIRKDSTNKFHCNYLKECLFYNRQGCISSLFQTYDLKMIFKNIILTEVKLG